MSPLCKTVAGRIYYCTDNDALPDWKLRLRMLFFLFSWTFEINNESESSEGSGIFGTHINTCAHTMWLGKKDIGEVDRG